MERSGQHFLSTRQNRRRLVQGSLATGLAAGASLRGRSAAGAVTLPGARAEFAMPVSQVTDEVEPAAVLFRDVRIFDGVSDALSPASSVLIVGNTIAAIDTSPITPPPGAIIIDGGRRTLMPGLIDAHWHAMYTAASPTDILTADEGYLNLVAAEAARLTLLRGFTTVRDMSGPCFGLKRAIDEGLVAGPRIYPSGAMITQTSGHGDFRLRAEIPRNPAAPLSELEVRGFSAIADGADAVLRATREQLMLGASQIKIAAGGGISSDYDPIDVTEYSEDEMRAAVGAAEDWGTYVAAHAYTPRAIQRALRAGVQSIEHGHLLDDATAEMMAQEETWLSMQIFLDDEDATPYPEGSLNDLKQRQVTRGTDAAYALAIKYDLKLAWGTDILFDPARPEQASRQGVQLAKLARWFTPAEALAMATSANAELCALCGPRNPYLGTLGVVQEGALADLILVDGNPLQNLELVADAGQNFLVIMKDGQIFKQAPVVTAAS